MGETPVPGQVYIVTKKLTSHGFPLGTRIKWAYEDNPRVDSLDDRITGVDYDAAFFEKVGDETVAWRVRWAGWISWKEECIHEIDPPDLNDINDIEQFLKEG